MPIFWCLTPLWLYAQTTFFKLEASDEGMSSQDHAFEGGFGIIALLWLDVTPWWQTITGA